MFTGGTIWVLTHGHMSKMPLPLSISLVVKGRGQFRQDVRTIFRASGRIASAKVGYFCDGVRAGMGWGVGADASVRVKKEGCNMLLFTSLATRMCIDPLIPRPKS